MNYKITQFEKINDDRGSLIVFLKESELDDAKKRFGQIYFVTFKKKGVVRGNHYHKKWHEWFGVVSGRVEVVLEDVRTKKRKQIIGTKLIKIKKSNPGNFLKFCNEKLGYSLDTAENFMRIALYGLK